jgi:hypothetical protein
VRPQIRQSWQCVGCQVLSHLFDYQSTEAFYTWDCGPEAGDHVSVEAYAIDKLVTNLDPQIYHFDTANYRYLACDTYTLAVLSSWCVQDFMDEQNVPHYQLLYTAHACADKGYLLTRHISSISSENEDSWLSQLLVILSLLNDMEYAFYEPTVNAFGWLDRETSYSYNGTKIQGNKTLVLRALPGSFTRLDQDETRMIRLYDAAYRGCHAQYNRYLQQDFVTSYDPNKEWYHVLDDSAYEILESQRAGFRFVPCFDVYSIFVSWVQHIGIDGLSPKTRQWFTSLWTAKDYAIVETQLRNNTPLLEILNGKDLRINLLTHSFKYIE